MANNENLVPFTKNSKEAKECGKKGAKKSAQVRREKRELKETLELLLTMENPRTKEDNQTSIALALLEQAMQGNVKAFEVIRDTIGQKPVNKEEITSGLPTAIYINRQIVNPDGTIEDDTSPI